MKPLRILLADDHKLFRAGLAALLGGRHDVTIVGQAENGNEAIVHARQTIPDVILMDIHMPGCDGLQATRAIKREMPQVQIIMLTVSENDEDLFEAVKCGAAGYLLKDLRPEQLFEMLDKVRHGEAPFSGTIATKLLNLLRPVEEGKAEQPSIEESLTPREIEVLEEVVKGYTNKEIASALHVTENTVKIHLRNILAKLQVENRLQAAVQAVREEIIEAQVEV